ncbi:MAG TPA: hydrogen gas-evolving membrane-bound hydrogenase subunit E [Solirubrobacteraceae bacterium]|nr:hydrogen gas-evolving membrane-bound hydrogenase subunit E [Solirubrobacteraceae bacterium]
MTRGRRAVAIVGVVLLAGGLAWGASGLYDFGHYHALYGKIVARDAVPDRSATNSVVVTAFDYRAFDTLGEEFILFVAVVGVAVLLRRLRGESGRDEDEVAEEDRRASESTRWIGMALVGPLVVLTAYIVVHGHLTPGGGFQGGVILMGAVAFVAVGGESLVLLHLRRTSSWVEMSESAGAAGFAMLGFGGLIGAGAFFQNFIANGTSGLLTGGFIPLANIAVGLEVGGALMMVISEFFDQRLHGQAT